MDRWLRVGLYAGPIALLVFGQCKRVGLNPVFPVIGLLIGVLVELRR